MTKNDIYDLLDVEIPFRDNLNINSNHTFGCEIEFVKAPLINVGKKMFNENLDGWKVTEDVTVSEIGYYGSTGGEIISPIMTNSKIHYQNLLKACEILKEEKARVNDKTASHVHLGAHILETNINNWKNFVKLLIVFENIMMRFSYGTTSKPRKFIKEYAMPIADILYLRLPILEKEEDLFKYTLLLIELFPVKTSCINFSNLSGYHITDGTKGNKHTIEFRSANGTLDPIIWQNNISFYDKLLSYAKSKNFDKEKIDYYLDNYKYLNYKIENTSLIDIEKVDTLSKMLYDDEKERLYFLKQYFKAYNENQLDKELRSSRIRL